MVFIFGDSTIYHYFSIVLANLNHINLILVLNLLRIYKLVPDFLLWMFSAVLLDEEL
jgi:hypothetical protein